MDHPKTSLRSDALKPSIEIAGDYDLSQIHHAVAAVVKRRASTLGSIDIDNIEMDGRLFGCYVRQTLFDGVSKMETNGFIDDTNTPPWDSWIGIADELLISWIPPAIVDDVQSAIVCNAEECIAWVTDIVDDPFITQLRNNQLVQ